MSKLASQWIDIFRAGNYGAKGDFPPAMLAQAAQEYDPALHESPAVIGHPQANLPAYGWAKKLRMNGPVLQAQFDEVDPAFEQMVEQGKFKKRSASFYKPGSGPTGRLYLRHVGFLGAQPPEVKGLKDVQFDDAGQETAEVDFEEEGMAQETVTDQAITDRVAAWFNERFGTKPQTASFSEEQVKGIAAAAVQQAVAPLQAQLDKHTANFAESTAKAATVATKTRSAEAIAKLKAAGKWIPAFDRAGLTVVFDELATADEVVEFGEGAGKKSLTPLDTFVSFMEQLPAIVPNAPVYTADAAKAASIAAAAGKTPGVNDSQRAPADPNSTALAAKTSEIMAARSISDYGAALAIAAGENPQLTVPGGAATGSV